MPRIVVVSPSPLLAEGLAAALRTVGDWDVRVGRAEDDADAWLLPGDEMVVRGAQGASAQLGTDASASRLRAAVGAVLEGLSVRESLWFVRDARGRRLLRLVRGRRYHWSDLDGERWLHRRTYGCFSRRACHPGETDSAD